jgi:UDP-3-O-[3-hydroxymyristoyl] glucosamine N-acyltransferase
MVWGRFPQIGGLIIEDDVEVGSHSDIKRAALENTIIKKGCKLGSYTNIGHNCIIGENSLFTSHCVVAGSNNIGNNFYCGINASIKNGMDVGYNVTLGANSFLNINAESCNTYVGTPAKLLKK